MNCTLVARALYDYSPQTEEELQIHEGEILFVTNVSDPAWWSATSRDVTTGGLKNGLIPSNYVEQIPVLHQARSLYPYSPQKEDELLVEENALLDVYNKDDPDWWLVKAEDGSFGLVPSNYLEETSSGPAHNDVTPHNQKQALLEAANNVSPTTTGTDYVDPLKLYALQQKSKLLGSAEFGPPDLRYFPITETDKKSKKKVTRKGLFGISDSAIFFVNEKDKTIISKWEFNDLLKFSERKSKKIHLDFTNSEFDFEATKSDVENIMKRLNEIKDPNLSTSQPSQSISQSPNPTINTVPLTQPEKVSSIPSPSMLSSPTKPSIAPSPASQVPSVTLSQSQVQNTVARLVGPPKIAVVLYDYTAQTPEELSIKEGENLMILEDSDPHWWKVRIVSKKGGEGLVPATYIQLKQRLNTVTTAAPAENRPPLITPHKAVLPPSNNDNQEDLENKKKAADDAKKLKLMEQFKRQQENDNKKEDIVSQSASSLPSPHDIPSLPPRPLIGGPPPKPERPKAPSVIRDDHSAGNNSTEQSKQDSIPDRAPIPHDANYTVSSPRITSNDRNIENDVPSDELNKSKPDPDKTRSWTDRSGTFKVDAQFIGLVDGKVHLHKVNGVKIAVPLEKLCQDDVDYLKSQDAIHSKSKTMPESMNHIVAPPLPERKREPSSVPSTTSTPPSNIIPPTLPARPAVVAKEANSLSTSLQTTYNGFDWLEFLKTAGVSPDDAAIYASRFVRERMDKSCLSDLSRDILKGLEVSEGDIIRIRKAAATPAITPAVSAVISERERLAQQKNLQLLDSRLASKLQIGDSQTDARSNQIKEDERLARELQDRELRGNDNKPASPNPNKGRRASRLPTNSSANTASISDSILMAKEALTAAANNSPVTSTSSSTFSPVARTSVGGDSNWNSTSMSTPSIASSNTKTTSSIPLNTTSSSSISFNTILKDNDPWTSSTTVTTAPSSSTIASVSMTPLSSATSLNARPSGLPPALIPSPIVNPSSSFVPVGSGNISTSSSLSGQNQINRPSNVLSNTTSMGLGGATMTGFATNSTGQLSTGSQQTSLFPTTRTNLELATSSSFGSTAFPMSGLGNATSFGGGMNGTISTGSTSGVNFSNPSSSSTSAFRSITPMSPLTGFPSSSSSSSTPSSIGQSSLLSSSMAPKPNFSTTSFNPESGVSSSLLGPSTNTSIQSQSIFPTQQSLFPTPHTSSSFSNQQPSFFSNQLPSSFSNQQSSSFLSQQQPSSFSNLQSSTLSGSNYRPASSNLMGSMMGTSQINSSMPSNTNWTTSDNKTNFPSSGSTFSAFPSSQTSSNISNSTQFNSGSSLGNANLGTSSFTSIGMNPSSSMSTMSMFPSGATGITGYSSYGNNMAGSNSLTQSSSGLMANSNFGSGFTTGGLNSNSGMGPTSSHFSTGLNQGNFSTSTSGYGLSGMSGLSNTGYGNLNTNGPSQIGLSGMSLNNSSMMSQPSGTSFQTGISNQTSFLNNPSAVSNPSNAFAGTSYSLNSNNIGRPQSSYYTQTQGR